MATSNFQFDGVYETYCEMPDGTVVLANPGEIHALDFDDPGPLWSSTKSTATVTTPPDPMLQILAEQPDADEPTSAGSDAPSEPSSDSQEATA